MIAQRLRRSVAIAALAPAACALGSAGCDWGDEGPPNPVPVTAPEPSTSTNQSSSGGGLLPAAGTVKRTVSLRNPFGGPPGNLMVDGDFELSTLYDWQSAQLGWYAFDSQGQTYLRAETGGLCRTGVRCGIFEAQGVLFGKGVAAPDSAMVASIWAKVPVARTCLVIRPMMIPCNFSSTLGTKLIADAVDPGNGWCHYQAVVSQRDQAICMYIENDMFLPEVAIVDSATLVPATGTVPVDPPQALPQAQQERIAAVVAWERKRRRFGRPERPAGPWLPLGPGWAPR